MLVPPLGNTPSGKPIAVPRSHGRQERRHSSRVRLAPVRSTTGSSGCLA